jgi:predicted RNA-binding protein
MSHELYKELYEARKQVKEALSDAKTWAIERANAEKVYRIALRQEMLLEREKRTPVTIIQDICKGKDSIADLRFKRDCAEALYKTAMEAINVYKKDIQTISEEIQREWGKS